MIPDVLYILGAGTTTESIARELGVKKTLLGVDAVRNGKTVAMDIDEKTLWALLEQGQEAKILISPIGAQGFILGRGNQQISARIVRRVGIRQYYCGCNTAQTPGNTGPLCRLRGSGA